MRLNVLFWNFNVKKGDALKKMPGPAEMASIIARASMAFEVDVLVLAECEISDALIADVLQSFDARYESTENPHPKIRFFTRFPGHFLRPFHADGRLAVRRLLRDGFEDVLLAGIHFIDRRNHSKEKQWREMIAHRRTLATAEKMAGHDRTILFGDLNLNPFDVGMLDPEFGLGAMMTWDLAEVHAAKKGGPRFYNAMWSMMGRPEAPGTYFWEADEPANPYWNCLDAVLIRPSLRRSFRDRDLRIVSQIPGAGAGEAIDLFRFAELHWKVDYSDHLPVFFALDLKPGATPKEVENGQSSP